jgi:hypothetical protein
VAHSTATDSRSTAQDAARASAKLAQQVAMRIEEDIVGSSWKFGARILTETVLRSSRCTPAPADAAAVIRAVQRKALQLGEAIENGTIEDARRRIDEIWEALREAYDLPKRKARRRIAA